MEYLIKWKGYSEYANSSSHSKTFFRLHAHDYSRSAQNTWEPAGNILTPQLLEEFEKRKLTHPSAVGDVAPSSKSSKTKSGPIAEPDATTPLKKSKLNKQAQKAPSMGAGELKPVCDTFAKEPTSAPSESPSVSFSKQSELPPDSTMVSTLVDGIQFIESDSVPTPALKKPKAKPQHKKGINTEKIANLQKNILREKFYISIGSELLSYNRTKLFIMREQTLQSIR